MRRRISYKRTESGVAAVHSRGINGTIQKNTGVEIFVFSRMSLVTHPCENRLHLSSDSRSSIYEGLLFYLYVFSKMRNKLMETRHNVSSMSFDNTNL